MNKENTEQGSNTEEPQENSDTPINEEETEPIAADSPTDSDELEADEEGRTPASARRNGQLP